MPIVGHAIRHGLELVYIGDDEQFDRIGRIAAQPRFRADRNTPSESHGMEVISTLSRPSAELSSRIAF